MEIETSSTQGGKYRKYIRAVDQILQSFDTISEWPDIITFLGRLSKTIHTFQEFTVIPNRLIIAKRLSQCLNPALPAGVHQKTIETYGTLFQAIGTRGLADDAALWFFGLFPFIQHASISVKPAVLDLVQSHCLKLGMDLIPCLKSLLLSVLPGLEEEDNELFEPTMQLLDKIALAVGDQAFYDTYWLALASFTKSRRAAINYLLKRSSTHSMEEHSFGNDRSLMVRGIVAALNDSDPQNLVQRGILDFINSSLPLHIKLLSDNDVVMLMTHAVTVVLRKDMSLNRRLYIWLLGEEEDAAYLREHALSRLVDAFRPMFRCRHRSASEAQMPYKVLISLLDKDEIGDPLTRALLLEMLVSLQVTLLTESYSYKVELRQTACMFLEMLNPLLLWEKIMTFTNAVVGPEWHSSIAMATFMLNLLKLSDEDVRHYYLPLTYLLGLSKLTTSTDDSLPLIVSLLSLMFTKLRPVYLADKGLRKLQPLNLPGSTTLNESKDSNPSSKTLYTSVTLSADQDMWDIVRACLAKNEQGDKVQKLDRISFCQHVVRMLVDAIEYIVQRDRESNENTCRTICFMLIDVIKACRDIINADNISFVISANTLTRLRKLLSSTYFATTNFGMLDIMLSTDLQISNILGGTFCTLNENAHLTTVIGKLVDWLKEEPVDVHVQSVHLLWEIVAQYPIAAIERVLAKKLNEDSAEHDYQAYAQFGIFWRHSERRENLAILMSQPLMHIFDALSNSNLILRRVGEAWLRKFVKSFARIIDPLLVILYDPRMLRIADSVQCGGEEVTIATYRLPFDFQRVIYAFNALLSLTRLGGNAFVRQLRTSALSETCTYVLQQQPASSPPTQGAVQSTFDALLVTSLRFVTTTYSEHAVANKLLPVQLKAAEFLTMMLSKTDALEHSVSVQAQWIVAEHLFVCVQRNEMDMQTKLLQLLYTLTAVRTHNAPLNSLAAASAPPQALANRSDSALPHPSSMQDLFLLTDNREMLLSTFDAEILHFLFRCMATVFRNSAHCAVWQNWIDFSLSLLALKHNTFVQLAVLLIECFTFRLNIALSTPPTLRWTDASLFLYGIERLLMHVLANGSSENSSFNGLQFQASLSGVVVYIPDMYIDSDSPYNSPLRYDLITGYLPYILSIFLLYFHGAHSVTLGHTVQELQSRFMRFLEKLYRASLNGILDAGILAWCVSNHDISILHILLSMRECTPEVVFSRTVVILREKCISGSTDQPNHTNMTVVSLCSLIDALLNLEAQNKSRTFFQAYGQLLREYIYNPVHQTPIPHLLRTLTQFVIKVAAIDDKRIQKEVQDLFLKVLDTAIQMASLSKGAIRALGQVTPVATQVVALNGVPPSPHGLLSRSSSRSLPDPTGLSPAAEIVSFLTKEGLVIARQHVLDNDRIMLLVTAVMTAIVLPALKDVNSLMYPYALSLLMEITKIPYAARAWKRELWDYVLDTRFLPLPDGVSVLQWHVVVKSLTVEPQRLSDVLSRVQPSQATSIFSSRDQELLARCSMLRRCSYAIFCGEIDTYVSHLPAIQEKIVDMLRIQTAAPLIFEIFLLMKVLFVRVMSSNLTNLWPIVIAETTRIFRLLEDKKDSEMTEDDCFLLLSTCKVIDVLCALGLTEFQTYQWIYVTDQIDGFSNDSKQNYTGLIDRLCEQLDGAPGQSLATTQTIASTFGLGMEGSDIVSSDWRRRPTLLAKHISSVHDLRHLALNLRNNLYADIFKFRKPDTAFTELVLEDELVTSPWTLSFAMYATLRPFSPPADNTSTTENAHCMAIRQMYEPPILMAEPIILFGMFIITCINPLFTFLSKAKGI